MATGNALDGKPHAGNPRTAPSQLRSWYLFRKALQAVALMSVSSLAISAAGAVQKKYLDFGWQYRYIPPAALLANADKFKDTAIDGVSIYLTATNSDGQAFSFVSHPQRWEREAFAPQLEDLRKIARTPHLSESMFAGFKAPIKRIAWTDDKGWENFANSMAVLGWLGRETGIKGLWCDHEDYHGQRQFVRLPSDPPYEELCKIVRRRGAQVFGALFKENPDVKLLWCWFMTFYQEYFTCADPVALARRKEDIWPAFVDGLFDVLPPTATIIEGNEYGYYWNYKAFTFYRAIADQRRVCPQLLSPEHRDTFLQRVQMSFGQYLDIYCNPKIYLHRDNPEEGSQVERFRRHLADVTEVSDEYVWFWGERHPTVHWEGVRIPNVPDLSKTWDEDIPGLNEMMLATKDPDRGLARRLATLRKEGRLVNLVANPSCKPRGPKSYPEPYSWWHSADNTNSTCSTDLTCGYDDSSSIMLDGTRNSSLILDIKGCSQGELYAVGVAAKGENAKFAINFKKDGSWRWDRMTVSDVFGEPDERGWKTVMALVKIPDGVDGMSFLLGSMKGSPDERLWFDSFKVYKLFP